MANTIKVKRGQSASLSSLVLQPGEVAVTLDTKNIYVGDNDGVVQQINTKGDTGNSGVYIGSTEPTDESVNVWIDPEGDSLTVPNTIIFDYTADETTQIAKAQEIYDALWSNTEFSLMMSLGGALYPAFTQSWGASFEVIDHFDIYIDMGVFSYAQDSDSTMSTQWLGYSFTVADDVITGREGNVTNPHLGNYLDPYAVYSTPFIPTDPGQPATKKYVDNTIAATFTLDGTSLYITTNAEMPSITFHVQNPGQTDTYYSFEIPNVMTWQEFIDSEYNTVPFHDGYGYPAVTVNGHVYSWNTLLSDSIIDGHFYDVSWTGEIE